MTPRARRTKGWRRLVWFPAGFRLFELCLCCNLAVWSVVEVLQKSSLRVVSPAAPQHANAERRNVCWTDLQTDARRGRRAKHAAEPVAFAGTAPLASVGFSVHLSGFSQQALE